MRPACYRFRMSMEHVTRLTCMQCGAHYSPSEVDYTCGKCGIEGILDIEFDYDRAARTLTREALAARPRWEWRYRELLPIDTPDERLPNLQVGCTPVYEAPRLAAALGLARLRLKDDGRNPTGSFKDRASCVGVVKAREKGASLIACSSTGNAASSLAGFAAAMNLPSVIFVPERAPEPKVTQLLIFGATVVKVQGTYDDAYYFCQDACAKHGWYNRNCAINPYLVEGKKSVGLEIGEELGGDMPDWVVFSVGDGCTIGGAWKGIVEMHRLGFVKKLPRMLGVQAAGAAPLVEAFEKGSDSIRAVVADTLADSIAVGQPRNWRKALRAIRDSKGAMVAVPDAAILDAMRITARHAAVFGEPAGSAAVAGLAEAVKRGIVGKHESALCVVTGNGLKDIKGAMQATSAEAIHIPPQMDALDAALKKRGVLQAA